MKKIIPFEITHESCWSKIIFKRPPYITADDCDTLMILVLSAKIMIGSGVRNKYIYFHTFYLDQENLTLVIYDTTKYWNQNATKIAKYLQRVYNVVLSRYGCSCGLKY